MVPATAPVIGFSEEIIWPMGQILLPVKIGDAEHFTSAWMNFVILRSPLLQWIIRSTGVRIYSSCPVNSHGMLKFRSWRELSLSGAAGLFPTRMPMVSGTGCTAFDISQASRGKNQSGNSSRSSDLPESVDNSIPKAKLARTWKCMLDTSRGVVLSLASPNMSKRCTKAEWKASKPKQIPLQISRKVTAILQNFKEVHKEKYFQWTAEAEAAFKEMKKLIAELPTLTAPMEKEELIVYLAAAQEAVSTVLMMEREAKQMPVYFVSRTLQVLQEKETG
ncbi:reverse transcriptase domain-containing protein [Tanacetum coccineum]|uniref:Reverse transcriptase domain-containing protein n=1 Tax=Tanacetum coccineum TaxID=301880 RepID=A0ABQ5CBQ9_9ASTR